MARPTLTDLGVAKLKPRDKRFNHPDPNLPGHYVRVTPTGSKSYAAIVRGPTGKQALITIGDCATLPIAEARSRARTAMQRVRDGLPAVEPRAQTFSAVAAEWLTRKAEAEDFRSLSEVRRHLTDRILPRVGDVEVTRIGKAAIAALLDKVQDKNGARSADICLTIIRQILRWHASRVDNFNPPLFVGMKRQSAKKQRRARILDDHEIRRVWAAADQRGAHGAMIKVLLLTAQRLDKVQTMRWDDIDSKGTWKIRTVSEREKPHGGVLQLPPLAMSVLAELPRFSGNPYVFSGRNGHINPKSKGAFDKLCGVDGWTRHDLRRSARSLMSRVGVSADIAERVLGHVMAGVRDTYDRHQYLAEKANALQRLADLVADIVKPGPKLVAKLA